MHKAGHTYCIYATFKNGLAYEFIEGDTLTAESVIIPEVYELVSTRMAEMHLLKIDSNDLNKKSVIWDKTEKFLELIPKHFEDPIKQQK